LLYGCGEITSQTLKLDTATVTKLVPKGTQLNTKFNSILLPNCHVGDKVQTKSCTIGSNITLGDRSKLNNVLVMDEAVIGENVILQNSVVGVGAKVGDNCNLKDCMVGSLAVVASGTKTTEKGEAFHV
jgi:NDP-sugar pyrophosphorylase family protein